MGQINADTKFGTFLMKFAEERTDLTSFVEVGTWDGRGSTRMLVEGLAARPSGKASLVSFDTDEGMLKMAQEYWATRTPPNVDLKLTYGRVATDMVDWFKVQSSEGFEEEMRQWFIGERANFNKAPLVQDTLPKRIDFLLLDGGEFTTEGDWNYLKTLDPLVVALDDTACFKCREIKEELSDASWRWTLVAEDLHERTGWAVYEKKLMGTCSFSRIDNATLDLSHRLAAVTPVPAHTGH